jgi:hypothetical protein
MGHPRASCLVGDNPERAAMDSFKVERDFPNLGRRTMLLKMLEPSSTTTTPSPRSWLLFPMSPAAFVHISAVERVGMREIVEGQKINYGLVRVKKSGKLSALLSAA